MDVPYLELRNITKYFAKVVANKDVSISLNRGETLALLGENGAGKSTVMKILYGLYKADAGHIYVDGEEVNINSPKDAMKYGISMIQQHFSLVMAHSVTENIILGEVRGLIDKKAHESKIKQLSDHYGFNVDPTAIVRELSIGAQQKVEILKVLCRDTHILIMDEPTAVLTPQETEALMVFVKSFTAKGNSVIFITHKLKEVMAVANRIVVMRDGAVRGDVKRDEADEIMLSKMMIGRELIALSAGDKVNDDAAVRLALEHVTVKGTDGVPMLNDISLTIRAGEILGVAGVSGNGQKELCETVCGVTRPESGRVLLDGEDISQLSINEHTRHGIGYIPSDRHGEGMVMEMSVAENMMTKTSYDSKWVKYGILDKQFIDSHTLKAMNEYQIKASDPDVTAKSLSGGNQQKVVVAREFENGFNLIVCDQPTRGLDLGAIEHVHSNILKARAAGKSVLLVSTELSELFALADRIAVLFKGCVRGIFDKAQLTPEKIGLLMAGFSADGE